jgi:hypothetical protein
VVKASLMLAFPAPWRTKNSGSNDQSINVLCGFTHKTPGTLSWHFIALYLSPAHYKSSQVSSSKMKGCDA